ncbi:MAG TPA: DUF2306 domain-containing protein [Pseudomonadota bacterium]|nr:DUF2306 domain-containing protein [Pseudomonadota bacterium]
MSPQLFATVHVGACAAALMLGAAVAAAPKGTAWHRRAGRAFMASMLVLNLSALGLYRLNGTFNGFHVLALISLAGLVAGWWCGRGARRSPLRRELHGRFMLWSYVGLLAAAASELVVRLPFLPRGSTAFVLAVAGASFLVAAIAVYPIERAMRRRAARGAP